MPKVTKKDKVLHKLLEGAPVSYWELHNIARTLYIASIMWQIRQVYDVREFMVYCDKKEVRYKMVYINPNKKLKKT